jgi:hypothetical protein
MIQLSPQTEHEAERSHAVRWVLEKPGDDHRKECVWNNTLDWFSRDRALFNAMVEARQNAPAKPARPSWRNQ